MMKLIQRANRSMIGSLGVTTGLLMIVLRIFVTQYDTSIALIHPFVSVMAYITMLMIALLLVLSVVRFLSLKKDLASLVNAILAAVTLVLCACSLPFWIHMPEEPFIFVSFFHYSFYAAMVLMGFNALLLAQAKKKISLSLLKKGSQAIRLNGKSIKGKSTKISGLMIYALILSLIISLGAHGASIAYHKVFTKIDLDLTSNLQVEFTGSDGYGMIKAIHKNIVYDEKNEKLKDFVDQINYVYDDVDNLKNGDIVKFKASYNAQMAADLHVHIINPYTYIEVSGLGETFKDGSAISEILLNEMIKDADGQMWSKYMTSERYKKMRREYHITTCSIWFAKAKTNLEEDMCVILYKIECPPTNVRPKLYYRVAYHKGLDNHYSTSTDKYWYCIYLKSETNDYITDEDDTENALIQRFSNFNLGKIKNIKKAAYKPSKPITVNPLD